MDQSLPEVPYVTLRRCVDQSLPEVAFDVTLRRCVDQSLPEVRFDPQEVCRSEPV